MISLKRKIKKFNFTFFKKTLLIVLFFSESFSQSINTEIHFLDNNPNPFWLSSNSNGIYSKGSITSFKILDELKMLNYGAEIIFPLNHNQNEKPFFNQAYLGLSHNNFYFQIGKKSNHAKHNYLSSGSLVESTNAMPISKILISTTNYNKISFSKFKFQYLVKFAHGWINSSEYIINPYLHEKTLRFKKEITEESFLEIGLDHMAIWAGETIQYGKQSADLSDFFRIIFALPAGINSINQEQENSLGNHLGAWSFSYEKKIKDKILKLYMEHPFEDESGARWILNEFDGLYGLNIKLKESSYVSNFTYEYINTLDQSGSKGASDSTYGWDNYYNHYI